MRIEVLCVGRRPPAWVVQATDDYTRRLGRGWALTFSLISPGAAHLGSAARKADEARRAQKRLATLPCWVALDADGKSMNSPALARQLGTLREQHNQLAMLIGGADGIDAGLLDAAPFRWSLSALTLPHALVRVVLAEQIYRAWSILEGHPYHRE